MLRTKAIFKMLQEFPFVSFLYLLNVFYITQPFSHSLSNVIVCYASIDPSDHLGAPVSLLAMTLFRECIIPADRAGGVEGCVGDAEQQDQCNTQVRELQL